MCGQLVKEEAGRVVYKNYSFGVKIFKIDMVHTFGGTNWGNLGYMGGHTLTATPHLGANGTYGAPSSIAVTAILGNGT
ncbi:hypothetical protein N7524_007403 [Penicillium chrysogenum]|nr:hypothetical protein N7524_007403 [Penicillium chrysogenum]